MYNQGHLVPSNGHAITMHQGNVVDLPTMDDDNANIHPTVKLAAQFIANNAREIRAVSEVVSNLGDEVSWLRGVSKEAFDVQMARIRNAEVTAERGLQHLFDAVSDEFKRKEQLAAAMNEQTKQVVSEYINQLSNYQVAQFKAMEEVVTNVQRASQENAMSNATLKQQFESFLASRPATQDQVTAAVNQNAQEAIAFVRSTVNSTVQDLLETTQRKEQAAAKELSELRHQIALVEAKMGGASEADLSAGKKLMQEAARKEAFLQEEIARLGREIQNFPKISQESVARMRRAQGEIRNEISPILNQIGPLARDHDEIRGVLAGLQNRLGQMEERLHSKEREDQQNTKQILSVVEDLRRSMERQTQTFSQFSPSPPVREYHQQPYAAPPVDIDLESFRGGSVRAEVVNQARDILVRRDDVMSMKELRRAHDNRHTIADAENAVKGKQWCDTSTNDRLGIFSLETLGILELLPPYGFPVPSNVNQATRLQFDLLKTDINAVCRLVGTLKRDEMVADIQRRFRDCDKNNKLRLTINMLDALRNFNVQQLAEIIVALRIEDPVSRGGTAKDSVWDFRVKAHKMLKRARIQISEIVAAHVFLKQALGESSVMVFTNDGSEMGIRITSELSELPNFS